MGKPGYGAHMHIDHVDHPSWQAQIRGSKLWTLEPVPECYNECRTLETVVKAGRSHCPGYKPLVSQDLDNRR
ncbi:uncharacterized protein CEXT_284871 [Caerostris extrusa]|uniref:Uncharacterized protein n=1 Tax=Caerostris extrusa TaxID=172846 RepID=A0AAV4S544_CAEEX|nr:uncharacterized protein CEXT_284871 [Caerostris extrusa]